MIVCSILLILSLRFCPIRFANTAFGPTENPTIRFTKIPTNATQLPTAANALSPANLPTTATSAELNSCCKILLNASGMENRISFPARPPFSISISFVFFVVSMTFTSLLTFYYLLSFCFPDSIVPQNLKFEIGKNASLSVKRFFNKHSFRHSFYYSNQNPHLHSFSYALDLQFLEVMRFQVGSYILCKAAELSHHTYQPSLLFPASYASSNALQASLFPSSYLFLITNCISFLSRMTMKGFYLKLKNLEKNLIF